MKNKINIQLRDIQEYAFCGLMYKYKHMLKLPYVSLNAEDVYVDAMRSAISMIFRDFGLRRKSLRLTISEVASFYKDKMDAGNHKFLRNPMKMYDLYAQGLVLINTMYKYIDFSKDVVAITDFRHSIDVGNGVNIHDTVDAIIIKNDNLRSERYYALTTVIDDHSPMATSSRFDDLHVGFARATMIECFNPTLDRPIMHQFLSLFGTVKKSHRTSHHNIDIFKSVARKLGTGIKEQIFLPSAHASKCRSCWYNEICSNKFVDDHVSIRSYRSIESEAKKRSEEATASTSNVVYNQEDNSHTNTGVLLA